MSPATTSSAFAPVPSISTSAEVAVGAATAVPKDAQIVGVLIGPTGAVNRQLGVGRAQLEAVGFGGQVGSVQVLPSADGAPRVAVGLGTATDVAALRDAAGAFGRAAGKCQVLTVVVPDLPAMAADEAAQAIVEGVLLSRYSYDVLRREPRGTAVTALTLVTTRAHRDAAQAGAERGGALAAATMLARDLANSPHSHLSATRLGIAPQTVQAAYIVGDGPANVLTPLMVYLPFIVTIAQRYDKKSGIGTIIALMLPYAVIILVAWIILYAAWFLLGIPLGPDSPIKL